MAELRRERKRRSNGLRIDKQEIANRVIDFFNEDIEDHDLDLAARLQRYAKFRQWTDGGDGLPWDDSSDQGLPDMMTASLRMQDTLVNAAMSARPTVVSRALQQHNREKQETVDDLLDYQFYVEQNGEFLLGEVADDFVNDGVFTALVVWINEKRRLNEVRIFPPIPSPADGGVPIEHFEQIIESVYPKSRRVKTEDEGWDWIVTDQNGEQSRRIAFYTATRKQGDDSPPEVQMAIEAEVEVFNGPKILPKRYADVITPTRVANLQAPSPSNPGGASHVILRDYPSFDEIQRLQKSGVYDMLSAEDVASLKTETPETSDQESIEQSDTFQGQTTHRKPKEPKHSRFTRLMCFDTFADGDGTLRDVVWWVLKEKKLLLRARIMTEVFPSNPPRRPFAEASFLPVPGYRQGIGLLEQIERLHDLRKQLTDHMIDTGTLQLTPFFFYRNTSSMKPELLRMAPGDGYPVGDPQNDINIANFQNAGIPWVFNMLSITDQWTERLDSLTELQFGRIPFGRASALRTSQNLQTVLGQGEARPERILRRFFNGLVQIWRQMHQLNLVLLPQKKQFRISGVVSPNEDPYREVTPEEIDGNFEFDFEANVQNTSKIAQQQALQALLPIYLNPLTIQMGLVDPPAIYRLLRDIGKSFGQNVNDYINEPEPGSGLPLIMAEEAIDAIMDTPPRSPEGRPLEGAQVHADKLTAFRDSDDFGLLEPDQVDVFGVYLNGVFQLAAQEAELQQQMQQAEALQAQLGPGGLQAAASGGADAGQPQVNQNELLDETLPSAGGGGGGPLQ